MKLKKVTSLTAMLAFLVMLLTSFILYIVPQGRIANWADWQLWGLSKSQWGDIHINTGVLFLLTLLLHIYYNWKPILNYLKNQSRRLTIFTKEFSVALALVVVFILGTYIEAPPFSNFLALNEHVKEAGAKTYGEPPYGHAELSSLKTFAKKMNIDLKESISRLEKAGYAVKDKTQSLAEIGQINNVPPQRLYLAMKPVPDPAAATNAVAKLPDEPPSGMGRRTLADLCKAYNLNPKRMVAGLAAQNITATAELSIKDIAANNKMGPHDVFDQMKTVAGTF